MKKVLVINFSQSGQLDEIVTNFISGLINVAIDRIHFKPHRKFPFPWKTNNFYNSMPETVDENPIQLEAIEFKEEKYDLIVLGYQPWFLSPSLPTSSLLQDHEFKKRMHETPIVTIIGARNMWLNAQESVVQHVQNSGGKLVGNIALVDRSPNHLSAISIVHWMMTGKKTRKWGIFPIPGVSQQDIEHCAKYCIDLNECIKHSNYSGYQNSIVSKGGIRINTNILFIEARAKKIFRLWARLIKKKESQGKNRAFWIKFFRFYLNFALFFVAPILLLLYNILIRPFSAKKINRSKKRFKYLGIDLDH
jgi:hypothetical protein